jgi:hypothetical protein
MSHVEQNLECFLNVPCVEEISLQNMHISSVFLVGGATVAVINNWP